MKFSVASSDLLKKLQLAGGVINSNPVLPILEDFLFQVKQNKLTISATDLETSIITEIEVTAEEDGEVAIPGRILIDTLKELPSQPISFEVSTENFGIQITSAYGTYKLAGENGADFPKIPEQDNVDEIKLNGGHLATSIGKTLFATSNDELRLAMTGVFFQVDFNTITLVATDAHKLVKCLFSGIESTVSTSFIVPKKSLSQLKSVLSGTDDVKMSFNKSNVFFTAGNVQLICRLIDAKYPDFNAVIPVDNNNILSLNGKDFQAALKRIAIYANKTTNQIVLSIKGEELKISAQDLDFANEATETQSCQYSGSEDMSIGFNAKFLIEMINVMDENEIQLKLSSPNKAGILVPAQQGEGFDLLMLVMPVMLNQ